ncbi:hypothetical protein BDW74DRAFT_156399 [Aspergillus multicolor]|uniref:uncharacterized protein n=1 Tax=Aspergillus multicolor TaxID=41759 RepID=UPI003CCD8690
MHYGVRRIYILWIGLWKVCSAEDGWLEVNISSGVPSYLDYASAGLASYHVMDLVKYSAIAFSLYSIILDP